MSADFVYCRCCGTRYIKHINKVYHCDVCDHKMFDMPDEYNLTFDEWLENKDEWNKRFQQLTEDLVKTSPQFDKNLFANKDSIQAEKRKSGKEAIQRGKAILAAKGGDKSYAPRCPTCGSPNVQPISGLERGSSVFAWGLFSKKINKSYKCNNCKYMW